MQITIEIPDELSNIIQNKGKSLNIAIIEALGLYIQHDTSIKTIPKPIQPEIDWAAKWEKWFAECETMPIPTTTQPPQLDSDFLFYRISDRDSFDVIFPNAKP
ncbi:hypothetical protein VB774_20155 [Pseudanabaena galeata UHCC 0370]|uniref:Arc-like DNA binding domain-containing protein n=1 Tax=Pseudanabaena galeata UHCC 0370 TaxID=3110310 RepID=A0ABU5TNM8_9CYAN|nr:hypothetical protein [Pseudanabaena galeata]MEA5479947.1 hypothetical protein [Pseudanabaena galeata UHCC 0370]